jgi:tellurite resistance protein TerC
LGFDSPVYWIVFTLFVLGMLALDLGIFNRKAHVIKLKEAAIWSVVWIVISLSFCAWLYFGKSHKAGGEFLAGYLLEKALSVDNIFVFIMIFSYFGIKPKYQHRLLFWGILGALVLRGAMIAAGAALLDRFHFIIYIFGLLLIYTGIKMAFHDATDTDPSKGWVYRGARKFLPVTEKDYGKHFLVKENGHWRVTMLLVVLMVVETTDVLFALDSIPAVFAVTKEPFLVYTSNIFAILGLRALYFLLAGVMDMFRYLKYGLAVILCLVGVKMLLSHTDYAVPIGISLSIIGAILLISVVASLIAARINPHEQPPNAVSEAQKND